MSPPACFHYQKKSPVCPVSYVCPVWFVVKCVSFDLSFSRLFSRLCVSSSGWETGHLWSSVDMFFTFSHIALVTVLFLFIDRLRMFRLKLSSMSRTASATLKAIFFASSLVRHYMWLPDIPLHPSWILHLLLHVCVHQCALSVVLRLCVCVVCVLVCITCVTLWSGRRLSALIVHALHLRDVPCPQWVVRDSQTFPLSQQRLKMATDLSEAAREHFKTILTAIKAI